VLAVPEEPDFPLLEQPHLLIQFLLLAVVGGVVILEMQRMVVQAVDSFMEGHKTVL
jgi:hypothetical protein